MGHMARPWFSRFLTALSFWVQLSLKLVMLAHHLMWPFRFLSIFLLVSS